MLLLTLFLLALPADTLTLARCYALAEAHSPLQTEQALHAAVAALDVQNLRAGFLPALTLSGQATYHSEVPRIDLPLPGSAFPRPARDQYRAGLRAEQLVYDGGTTAGRVALARARRDQAQQEVAVELYHVRERVEAAYFGVLLQQARLASLASLEADLQARLGTVRVRIDGGVLLPASAEVLEVERIQLAQQQAEAEAHRRAALAVLGLLIGRPLPDETVLALPDPTAPAADARRPEYAAFDRAKTRLDRQAALADRATRPRVSVFAEAAAGRPPGLDFFENRLTPFYTAGLRVAWQPWDWRTSEREREMLLLRRAMVEARADAFARDVAAAAEQQRREVARLEALLASDAALLERRRRITAEAAVRFENGALTATDFLLERNAEHRARLARDLHRVQLAQARARYLTLLGDDR